MVPILIAVGVAASAGASDPCAATAGHSGYTILLQPNGQFRHCRGGETTEYEPMTEERVVLQLPPEDPSLPFRYRLYDPAATGTPHHHRLLHDQLATLKQYEAALHDLANSSENLSDTLDRLPTSGEPAAPPSGKPGEAPPASEEHEALQADAAQAKYLSHVTPAFVDAFRRVRQLAGAFDTTLASIDTVCALSAERVHPGTLRDRVAQLCSNGGPSTKVAASLKPFRAAVESFVAARAAMKDSVIDGHVLTNAVDPAAVRKAITALNAASSAAEKLVAAAGEAAVVVGRLEGEVQFLRAAIAFPATDTGARLHLGRFAAGGWFSTPDVYQVRVVRERSPLFEAEAPEALSQPEPRDMLVDRFQPVARPFLSLGVSLMYAAGLPDHPDLVGRLGAQTLVKVKTEGFVGGVEVSLKPLEFTHIPDPVASLLHFPVVVVPFTLNPLENYFIGAGIGWDGLGSIDVGVHMALTTVPAPDTPYGTQFTTSPIQLAHVTQPGPLAAGYFVGVTVDVLGVVQTIVAAAHPHVRDVTTGNESH